jgi:hypothetical protein
MPVATHRRIPAVHRTLAATDAVRLRVDAPLTAAGMATVPTIVLANLAVPEAVPAVRAAVGVDPVMVAFRGAVTVDPSEPVRHDVRKKSS